MPQSQEKKQIEKHFYEEDKKRPGSQSFGSSVFPILLIALQLKKDCDCCRAEFLGSWRERHRPQETDQQAALFRVNIPKQEFIAYSSCSTVDQYWHSLHKSKRCFESKAFAVVALFR